MTSSLVGSEMCIRDRGKELPMCYQQLARAMQQGCLCDGRTCSPQCAVWPYQRPLGAAAGMSSPPAFRWRAAL
eukprot:5705050-Prorocentrum_lima.AAC.1